MTEEQKEELEKCLLSCKVPALYVVTLLQLIDKLTHLEVTSAVKGRIIKRKGPIDGEPVIEVALSEPIYTSNINLVYVLSIDLPIKDTL